MDIVKRLRRPGIADYEMDCGVADAAAHEIEQLRKSLARCLEEAEGWLDEARGCKPSGVMDYDGWADEARRLLGHNVE